MTEEEKSEEIKESESISINKDIIIEEIEEPKPFYKKDWFIYLTVLVILLIIISIWGGG